MSKDNTLLYLGAGAAAVYFFAPSDPKTKIDVAKVIQVKGLSEGINEISRRVALWPVDPAGAHYQEEKVAATKAAKAVLILAQKANDTLFEVAESLQKNKDNAYIFGIAPGAIFSGSAAKMAVELYNLSLKIQNEIDSLNIYIGQGVGTSRLKDVIRVLLAMTKQSYDKIKEFEATWTAKVLSLSGDLTNAAQYALNAVVDVLKDIKDIAKGAMDFLKYLPYVALGLGGLYFYNNYVKEKS